MQNVYFEKLIKIGIVFLVILSLFFLVLAANAIKENRFIGVGVPASNTITVSGEGEVFAVPDVVEFSFSVIEERKTVDAAQEASTEKTNSLLSFLEEQGIDEKDIKTIGYNVYPRYELRGPENEIPIAPYPAERPLQRVLVSYEIRQSVSVKVRDTEEAGTILAGVGERGASDISGLSFTIDDESALEREARQKAIDDAQQKAEDLADDLDVRLVRVVNFFESGPSVPYYARSFGGDGVFMDEAAVAQAVPELPAGENRITANVSIIYEIR